MFSLRINHTYGTSKTVKKNRAYWCVDDTLSIFYNQLIYISMLVLWHFFAWLYITY